jgi:hypothetical protein
LEANSTLPWGFAALPKNPETALSTLLINFVSLSLEKGKDPQHIIEKHLPGIVNMLEEGKKIDNT